MHVRRRAAQLMPLNLKAEKQVEIYLSVSLEMRFVYPALEQKTLLRRAQHNSASRNITQLNMRSWCCELFFFACFR